MAIVSRAIGQLYLFLQMSYKLSFDCVLKLSHEMLYHSSGAEIGNLHL